MNKKKILLVTGFFPPYSPLGAVRPPSLAAYWVKLGYDVRVIAIENPQISGMLPSPLPAEAVSYVPFSAPGSSVESVMRSIRGLFGRDASNEGRQNPLDRRASAPLRTEQFNKLRQFYRQILMFPDRYRSWIAPAVEAGLSVAENWKPDLIYSSCPPHSGHIVAQKLSVQLNVPWVAELRDLWANNPYNDIHPVIQPFQKYVANSVLKHAVGCVALTVSAAEEIASTLKCPTIVSYNGYGAEDFSGMDEVDPEDGERLTIIHAGIIYAGRRDPTILFQALAILGRKRKWVRVKFYHDSLESVAQSAERLGVQECVQICEPVPRSEILRLERAVDVLLLCRWANPADDGIIPGKVFEYIGARRPILAIGSTTGEAADIVRKHEFGLVCNSPVEIAKQLAVWIDRKKEAGGRIPDLPVEPSKPFVREVQFEKVTEFIDGIMG